MSLLSICQQVAASIPVAVPTSIVENTTDSTATLLLASAQDEGEALARRPQGGWVAMIKEYDFVTAALAQQAGTIANSGAGGVAVISGLTSTAGIVASTWYAFGTGVINDSIVETVNSMTEVTLNTPASQTGAGEFTFGQSDYQLPSDFERAVDNTFWDRGRYWSMRGPQSPQQWQIYKSSVIGRASIQRRYRFRRISGNNVLSIDPVPIDNATPLVFEYVSNAWCESESGNLQSSWMADTDVGIIDEYLIRLGVKWRMLRRLGMSYAEEKDEYDHQVSKAIAQDGAMAILDLAPSDPLTLIGPWNLPETGFGNLGGM